MRPSTMVDVKVFVSGNTAKNVQDLKEFIRSQELTRNQIVSITSHEAHIVQEDDEPAPENELLLFYRKDSIVRGAQPLDDI